MGVLMKVSTKIKNHICTVFGIINTFIDKLCIKFRKVLFLIYYISLFSYLELLIKVFAGYNLFTLGSFNNLIYLLMMSVLCYLFSKLGNNKVNKIITYSITIGHCLYYAVQFGSYSILKVYFTLAVSDSAAGILQFKNELINIIRDYFLVFLLFFLPVLVLIRINKFLIYKKFNMKRIFSHFIAVLVFLALHFVTLGSNGTYSAKALTFNLNDMGLSVPVLGLSNSAHLDLFKFLTKFEEKVELTFSPILEEIVEDSPENSIPIEYDYNLLNIDFESNPGTISDYLSAQTGTKQNAYTGMFEGKNAILIMAESFCDIAVIEELTPTLYQLIHEGFHFTNFYSPTIFSTIGGEFQMLTGLYPTNDSIQIHRDGNNTYPYSVGATFSNHGYTTNAYHNNDYTFQGRNRYIPALGFDTFMACGNGLEEYIDPSWLQSDTDMVNSTVDFYSSEDKFFTFYATVSGHGSYDRSNKYAVANMDRVEAYLESKGLDYPSEIKYYIGAQMELESSINALLMNLENSGVLQDTVIIMAGDHYPYLISNDKITLAADYNKDDDIDINKSNLIIWNSEMEPEVIDKVTSQLDIVPTMLNLFGLDYDSRLMVGRDVFSNQEGLAMFVDRSWITDRGRYYFSDKTFYPNDGVEYNDDYISAINSDVANKISISLQIVLKDYYKDLRLLPISEQNTMDDVSENSNTDSDSDDVDSVTDNHDSDDNITIDKDIIDDDVQNKHDGDDIFNDL